VPLQTVCIRHVPRGTTDEKLLAAHNLGIAMRVNEGGRAYVTPSVLKGKQMIRVSVGATATERKDVELVWRELRQAADARGSPS
jgi:aromatic-L-amino-acid decarboxylase